MNRAHSTAVPPGAAVRAQAEVLRLPGYYGQGNSGTGAPVRAKLHPAVPQDHPLQLPLTSAKPAATMRHLGFGEGAICDG